MNSTISEATMERVSKPKRLTLLKWGFMVLFLVVTALDGLNLGVQALEPIAKVLIFFIAWLHGIQRYGIKNMLIWFGITWLVSNSFESLSIATGFPYGRYHYEIPGPRIANVPVLIMPSYFGMGYIAWTLAQILTGQYHRKLEGLQIFIVPFLSAFIMTAYDVVTDPIASTVHSRWIWQEAGAYFGVPLTNFAGWLFVVFCYQQIFALFIARYQTSANITGVAYEKTYWVEPIIVYSAMGLLPVIQYFTHPDHKQIFGSMALVSIFTMVLTAMISCLAVRNQLIERKSL